MVQCATLPRFPRFSPTRRSGFLFNEEITIIENLENYFCHFRSTHKNVSLISNFEDCQRLESATIFAFTKGSTNMYFLHLVETYHKSIHFVIAVHRRIPYKTQEGTLREGLRLAPNCIKHNLSELYYSNYNSLLPHFLLHLSLS
jgi:hypothetical protein